MYITEEEHYGLQLHIQRRWGEEKYPIRPRFSHFTSKERYEKAEVIPIEPMTAKEIETEEVQDSILKDSNYFVEEKFDGTRGVLHFLKPKKFYPKALGLEEAERLLCEDILLGSSFSHGKNRIYEYFIQDHSIKEKAEFLKNEYGLGGGTREFGYQDHSPRGLSITVGKLTDPEKVYNYTWTDVANFTQWLIDEGYYYPQSAYTRCFSRRMSVKTDWYTENTDSLPQLRDLDFPDLDGTIIDGEMFIPNQPFKAVSSTLNCLWDEAVRRQMRGGMIVFHAFDILYYKGKCVEDLPLWKRKILLASVVKKVNSPFIKMVKFYSELVPVCMIAPEYNKLIECKDTYPSLYQCVLDSKDNGSLHFNLNHKAYYEYIVMTGGEGVIVKPKNGQYFHKRGREYQKIKKFLTREVIIIGFSEPTKYYDGKFPNDYWQYWCDAEDDTALYELEEGKSAKAFKDKGYLPVTKYYYEDWVGNIRYGVVITNDEVKKLDKKKKFNLINMVLDPKKPQGVNVIEVGECSGFDEEIRQYLTKHKEEMIGTVIEVMSNEVFKDTGKMRHPRFLRPRPDKSALECTWKDHIGE